MLAGRGWEPTLRALYPAYEPVRFGGRTFPVTVRPVPPGTDLDAVLGDLDPTPPPGFDASFDPRGAAEYRAYAAAPPRQGLHDGPTYAAVRVRDTADGPRVDARPGSYFASLATAEALEREFVEALAADPDRPVPPADLPRRAWLHERLADPVRDGRFRAGALSVATTVLLPRPGGHAALLVRRSWRVRTHPGFLHVAPAGILAPPDRSHWREGFSVRQTVYREFAEELFGLDLETTPEAGLLDSAPVRALLDGGAAELHLCGVSVPLLHLRPEICVLLRVHDPALLRGTRNWEVGRVLELPLDEEFRPLEDVTPDLIPAAAGALRLARSQVTALS
ncbi:hypothetical protein Val02_11550 [Virgisporangium aliadipatigenens]|uniref:Uncharacterized protein n=1 Tax=Virgisporangium aliadipatigenens TaxID=741659 RepID=A0A8J3YFL7_9ACTN|nr:hypothetical protein Val02_11550 [Virgisporangium aliadipatigenens]